MYHLDIVEAQLYSFTVIVNVLIKILYILTKL